MEQELKQCLLRECMHTCIARRGREENKKMEGREEEKNEGKEVEEVERSMG